MIVAIVVLLACVLTTAVFGVIILLLKEPVVIQHEDSDGIVISNTACEMQIADDEGDFGEARRFGFTID